MRGISEEYLINSLASINEACIDDTVKSAFTILTEKLISECRELQEPWIPIDEFLKSESEVWCWIIFTHGAICMSLYQNNEFYFNSDTYETYYKEDLTHVMPIHKPEPPR